MNRYIKQIVVLSIFNILLIGCSATSPAPVSSVGKDYNAIERGSYKGSYYEVQKGDTLYFVAYITGRDVNELVRYNELSAPYTIHPGQKLKLWQPVYKAPAYGRSTVTEVVSAPVTRATTVDSSVSGSSTKVAVNTEKPYSKNSSDIQSGNKKTIDLDQVKEYSESKGKQIVNSTAKANTTQTGQTNNKISKWYWPTKGRVIKKFSAGEQGNKGIDIAGQRGQSIVSTANGTVVYSGNALRGYGNLIIVKHNDNYLSAYAHNDSLLVNEGQHVKAGQKIATMGSSGSNKVKLHFEIRYQGKSVNPQRYLP